MQLKSQLKRLLASRGMTAAQLSRKTGVSKQVLSLWLAGSPPKRIDQLKKVADAFSITIDELCFGKNALRQSPQEGSSFAASEENEWKSGLFEVRFRRISK